MRREARSLAILLVLPMLLPSLGCDAPAITDSPTPGSLLRGALDELAGMSSVQAEAKLSMHVQAMGQEQTLDSDATIRYLRPDKFAIVAEGGMYSGTAMTDGEQIIFFLSMLNRYTVSSVSEAAPPFGLPSGTSLSEITTSFDPDQAYQQLEAMIESSEYIGREQVDGIECHHCRYDTATVSVEVWYEIGDRPLVRKIVPDMTKVIEQSTAQNETLKDMELAWVVTITDWNTNAQLSAADFTFTPPDGAEQVDSLFGGLGGRMAQAVHPLVGQPAPSFEVSDLEGKPISLASYLGENVVMLDFWATWCGPCVEALPMISEVAHAFKDRGVVFYAVNIGEDQETVASFLTENKLDVPVALDAEGDVAQLYQASAIPQTVLIGKDGSVQVVHVGFGGGVVEQLTKELEQLLAGEDLAAATVAETAEAEAERAERLEAANSSPELTVAWTHEGSWSGVAVDNKDGSAYAISRDGQLISLDASGQRKNEQQLQRGASVLRLAQLAEDGTPSFLVFDAWSSGLTAFASDGAVQWEYPPGDGIDDVWAADLDGDGRDEVIVGHNGGTGLQVLASDGTAAWSNTTLGNVWHVCAGDLSGDGALEVITTSARGVIHVFAGDGESIKELAVPIYAHMIRAAITDGTDRPAVALAAGSGNSGEALICVNIAGDVRWESPLPHVDTPHVDSMSVAASLPLAAVAMRGGLVHIVDLETGQIIAHAVDQGELVQVAWLERQAQQPLLLVASGSSINAFEIPPASID